MKYLFQIGTIQTNIYDTFVKMLADDHNNKLTLDTIKLAIKVLEEQGINRFYSEIDALSLLKYFMEKENVDVAFVVEKTPKWD